VSWHPRQLGPQTGRTFVVTGANSGIGLEVARNLVERGAHVVLAVRDTAKGAKAGADLAGHGSTRIVELDLADLEQVAACATNIRERHDHIAALICNAGVMGGPKLRTPQGLERQMATNHFGHAALIAGLWPLLHASAARIVIVSSNEARYGRLSPRTTRGDLVDPTTYDGKQVYRDTKQANLLFAHELHRRATAAGSPVSVVAVHPGAAATNLLARQLDRSGRHRLAALSSAATRVVLPSAAAGARSTLRALDPSTPSGAFVSPAKLGGFRGPPVLRDTYPSAADPATSARLWALTEEVLGRPIMEMPALSPDPPTA
jgi:NAD(P)-dependent dehydrogenase (short-subunit alcohol dehydrogenase family)